MKTTIAVGLAIGLGFASMGWAFDQDALNSKKALVSYGKKAEKEMVITEADAAPAKKAEVKKATVAVTHDRKISSDDRDLGKADTSSINSKKALTNY